VPERETADLSTTLRSGRDDKGEAGDGPERRLGEQKPQISPLRFAPVEMTKGGMVLSWTVVAGQVFHHHDSSVEKTNCNLWRTLSNSASQHLANR
jgi:hypothetical protein